MIESKMLRWTGHVTQIKESKGAFKMLTVKSTEKGDLKRPSRRWEDNFRIDLKETGINTRNCIDLSQDMDYW